MERQPIRFRMSLNEDWCHNSLLRMAGLIGIKRPILSIILLELKRKAYPGTFSDVSSPLESEKGKLTLWAVRPLALKDWHGTPVNEETLPGTLLFDGINQRVAVACLNQTLLAVYAAQWQVEKQTTEFDTPETVYQALNKMVLNFLNEILSITQDKP